MIISSTGIFSNITTPVGNFSSTENRLTSVTKSGVANLYSISAKLLASKITVLKNTFD
jgi:hypothetical protein